MEAGDRGAPTHSTRPDTIRHAGAGAGTGAVLDRLGLTTLELVEPSVIARDSLDGIRGQGKGKESSKERGCCLHVHLYASF